MESKQFLELVEAYSAVYAPQEVEEATAMAKRGLDEPAIRKQIAAKTKGGESADKATALADKQTYGQSGVDPKARQRLAATQRGDFRKTASSNPGLHGYAHKATNPADKAKQDARGAQRGVLTPNEKKKLNREEFDIFEVVLEFLCVEGYAETLEEAEWMMANVIDEEAIDIILGEGYKPLPKDKIKNKANKLAKDTLRDVGTTLNPFKSDYEKDVAKHNLRKREKRVNKMVDALKTHKETRNEGYMDEAQHARENPEGHDAAEKKKYAPVRGEKTPMPPRGNKRREDFEKWYAANVR